MADPTLHSVWPVLLTLLYIMIVSVCRVLRARIEHELEIHNRIRQSKLMRMEYLEEMANKRFDSVDFEQ